ncbi:MAG TPA: pectinesterase family protein [Pyrinomonadaceae bacterium]|jgi:pectin methylesterase-like acyl-CoA thioesterase
MKTLKPLLLVLIVFTLVFAVAKPFLVGAATQIDDTFVDRNSQNQDLANNSLRVFKGRSGTIRTDAQAPATPSVTFNTANSGGAEGFWAFFTDSGSPVTLGVGDSLSVSNTFSLTGFNNISDIRFGVLDSKGTRNTGDLTGGMSENSFSGDTGYALQYNTGGTNSNAFTMWRRNILTATNVFSAGGDFTAISGTSPSPARQNLVSDTAYTLTYRIERLSATNTRLSVSVTDGASYNLNYSVVEASQTPGTTFDYFAFRVPAGYAQAIKFTRLKIDYSPAAPVINSQPSPTNQTVPVGSNVTLSVGATGNELSYQWRKNDNAITANASAATPTLQLTNLQIGDSGAYDVVVRNPGGSVSSNRVLLTVTDGSVEPAPIITQQPQNATATVNSPASLSVTANGNGLFYQWFKNGAVINGATNSTLNFASAQISDAADYAVTVSNGGGSVTSNPARLTVVSTMGITAVEPFNSSANICTDTPLRLTFNQTPLVGNAGKIRIFKADGTLVDTIDMASAAQTKNIGGNNFNYYPILISGNTASIYPHAQLAYNTTYYVTIEPGVLKDAAGAPFAGFTNPNTLRFTTKAAAPATNSNVLTVAANGSGDFCTVQGAVDFVPANNAQRVIIDVRNGTYTGIVYIPSNKPFITVRGESRDGAVLQYPNNNNLNPSTVGRAMFGVEAADFNLENITLHNTTPLGGSQAEALRTNGARASLIRVNLKSFQDTLLTQKSAFITDSYIEGDVDFMWGNGATYFKNTELKMLRENLGYYTQIRNNASTGGNVYVNCRLTKGEGVTNGSYLSRIDPDQFPFSQVVFIDTAMDSHIRPDAWRFDDNDRNGFSNPLTQAGYPNIRFWEYNTRDLNNVPTDVSQRHLISRQITAAEADFWRNPANVIGYTPQEKLTALVALSNLTHNFDGSPKAAAATTNPTGLNVSLTYNGSSTPPFNAGTYTVAATVQDANYQGTASGTLVINPAPAAAISLGNLNHVYNGSPKEATAITTPQGLSANLTYDGSSTPPTNPGSYVVEATISDSNYTGRATGKLNIFPNRPLAFPGAEGYGAFAQGGRGGDVYRVTNLNDTGAGSLREGIRTAPTTGRTIVFDVSGTIYLQSRLTITKPYITIAGQTAPGDGITVAGESTVITNTHNIIVRYMRFRPGDLRCANGFEGDSLWVDRSSDVIIDHVSTSWSVDESLSVTDSNRVTVQWSLITESLKLACHDKGTHGYGSLLRYGNGSLTFHHNLYAHHLNRSPRIGDNLSVDFANNVAYDWTSNAGYSGEASEGTPNINYINNYFIAGPSTPSGNARNRAFSGGSANTLIYSAGNLIDSNINGTRDGANTGWAMIMGAYTRQTTPFDFPAVSLDDAQTAYNRVLEKAGSSIVRDSVDSRVLNQVATDTGTQINSQNEVGGFPTLNSLPAQLDSDADGMPNSWEISRNLNPFDSADGRIIAANGYSNLENYLNSVTASPVNVAPVANADSAVTDEDNAVTIDAIANDTDENGDILTLSAVGNALQGTIEIVGNRAVYTPSSNFNGTDSFTYIVSDGVTSATGTITVTVNPVNDAPVLNNVPASAMVNELSPFTFTATAGDADSSALTFSLINQPDGAFIDSSTGQFSWTPTEAQGGTGQPYNFTVVVSDGVNTTSSNIALSVQEVNQTPVLARIGDQTVYLGKTLTFTAVGSDADIPTQTLSYSLTGAVPDGASINAATGAFNWTPTADQVGKTYTFDVTVTDSLNGSATETINIAAPAAQVTPENPAAQLGSTTITFTNITEAGVTVVEPINPATISASLPASYQIFGSNLAYEIQTTATFSGDITIAFKVPGSISETDFRALRIMHGENGQLVDRTVLPPNSPAPNFATKTIYARVSSLGTFVLAKVLYPTNIEQCKSGGYLSFSNPSFRNQGECVSYVQSRSPVQH